ncbi:hypothetical protein ACXJY6_03570 [Vibrio sp. RC27]
MEVNKHIYLSARQFLQLCQVAEIHSVEIYDYKYAYNANLAFSIELFLKSIDAISEDRLVLEVGDAQIFKSFTKSNLKGHRLSQLFSKLGDTTQSLLDRAFESSKWNLGIQSLLEVLELLDNAFIDNRYSYENAAIHLGNDPELLLATAQFFNEVLVPQK